jgi:hypothetical protein
MRKSRIVLIGGILVLVFAALTFLSAIGHHSAITPLATVLALVILIGGGNLLYGKNSHGARAQARVRPAQEAQNRAIDEARLPATDAAAPATHLDDEAPRA